MPKEPKRAIAYLRVSTADQGDRGAGLDLQMTRIEAFAKEKGFHIVETPFKDVQTGTDTVRRSGVRDAIDYSRKHRLPIIVDGLDRISRDTATLERWISDGRLKIISAKSGEDAGRAVIIAEAARAQAEVERISRTTREGLQRARARGARLGNPTNLEDAQKKGAASNKEKAEQRARELAPLVKELLASGVTTREAIAKELNARGHRTARGERWNKNNIRRPLDRILDRKRPAKDMPLQPKEPEEDYRNNALWGMF